MTDKQLDDFTQEIFKDMQRVVELQISDDTTESEVYAIFAMAIGLLSVDCIKLHFGKMDKSFHFKCPAYTVRVFEMCFAHAEKKSEKQTYRQCFEQLLGAVVYRLSILFIGRLISHRLEKGEKDETKDATTESEDS